MRVIFILLIVLFSTFTGFSFSTEEKPLNVIIVLVDDMGYGDIAAHGNPILKTPNFDKLHEVSARFTNFAVSPTCAPTRFDETLTVPGDQIVKKMSDFYEVWWKKVAIKMKEKWGEK